MSLAASYPRPGTSALLLAYRPWASMIAAINILVQYAINDWLTWGAITYPFAFLVSELVNRRFGPAQAQRGMGRFCGGSRRFGPAGSAAHCGGFRTGVCLLADAGYFGVRQTAPQPLVACAADCHGAGRLSGYGGLLEHWLCR